MQIPTGHVAPLSPLSPAPYTPLPHTVRSLSSLRSSVQNPLLQRFSQTEVNQFPNRGHEPTIYSRSPFQRFWRKFSFIVLRTDSYTHGSTTAAELFRLHRPARATFRGRDIEKKPLIGCNTAGGGGAFQRHCTDVDCHENLNNGSAPPSSTTRLVLSRCAKACGTDESNISRRTPATRKRE